MKNNICESFNLKDLAKIGYDAFLKTFSFDVLPGLFSNIQTISLKSLYNGNSVGLFDNNDLSISLYVNLSRNYARYLNNFQSFDDLNIYGYNIKFIPCAIGFISGGLKSIYKTKPEHFSKGAIKTIAYEFSSDNIKIETSLDVYKSMVAIEMIGEIIDYAITGKFDFSGVLLGSVMITGIIQFPYSPLKDIGDRYIEQLFSEYVPLTAEILDIHNSEFL